MKPAINQRRLNSLYRRRLTRFQSRLAAYIDDTNEQTIHKVRTAYRRLEVSYRLYPQSARTQPARRFFQIGKAFFRNNSVLRDCDVIESRLGTDQDKNLLALRQRLHQIRARQLKAARKSANRLCNFPPPQLFCDEHLLAYRLRKKTARHAAAFLPQTRAILAGEAGPEALHDMRKNAKKLYYLLELDKSLVSPRDMKLIRRFQRWSGRIHDCDVTLEFLHSQSRGRRDFRRFSKAVDQICSRHRRWFTKLLESPEWKQLLRRRWQVDS